ncbi:hypothetical protein Nepgr_015419 [Nepenthes gracilis]|uniref:F-box domain-containing protein n=1 Tax=Nepenthes gracilis TaxID=150966 RepID=A0AAD3SL21_NEPGR|nr:hypothetical protein Nepgr_015419 [Nepenthes gracilis]
MKLRIRSLESKETGRIEVPNACTLQQLKQSLAVRLSHSSATSFAVPENLFLSLNSKDELCGSSPEASLQSLGVTSGDLIYYTCNPYAFSSQKYDLMSAQTENPPKFAAQNEQTLECPNSTKGKPQELNTQNDQTEDLRYTDNEETLKYVAYDDQTRDSVDSQTLELKEIPEILNSSKERNLESLGEDADGVDDLDVDEESVSNGKTSFSVPRFLRKVFTKEVGDVANGGDHRLLVIAVHAVLLESGFIGYDQVSGMKVDGFHLPDQWPSSAFTISLCYTLPEISSSEIVETVVLKFQSLGKFVNVYGYLPKKGFGLYRVCLDESRFVPALNFVWNHSDYIDAKNEMDGSKKLCPEREVFEFWKIVKDGLALPLLIDLYEKAGFLPPPCFMRLPTELKLKILELLPGVYVARAACVCSELRFISSNNDLWRQKYAEEFGNDAELWNKSGNQWKTRFYSAWENRKKRKRAWVSWRRASHLTPTSFPGRRAPNPFGLPFVIRDIVGGDYDRIPGLGIPPHFAPSRRIFSPNCHLGGFFYHGRDIPES